MQCLLWRKKHGTEKNEKLENSRVELEIAIDAATFGDAVSKAFKKNAGKFNIPGFRKGKAPRHLIEQMYGKDVFHYDAVNDLFPEVYEEAVKVAGSSRWSAPRRADPLPVWRTALC